MKRESQSRPWLPWEEDWTDYLYTSGVAVPGLPRFYRNWDSSSSKISGKRFTPKSYRFVPKLITVPRGPRLAYKVRLPNGRLVWKRQNIIVTKYVRESLPGQGKKRGVIASPNFLDYKTQEVFDSNCNGTITCTAYGQRFTYTGDLMLNISSNRQPFGPNMSNFYDLSIHQKLVDLGDSIRPKAISKFYSKAKNQSINLAQAIAERAQTTSMIASGAVNIAKAILAVKRGNFVAAAKAVLPNDPKGLANAHLMYQYGIKPLINDVDGMAKFLAAPEDFRFKIQHRQVERFPHTKIAGYGPVGGLAGTTEVWLSGKVTKKFVCHVKAAAITRDLSRLGFYNPASLAWELLPYSFVLDWFIPIGNYLNDLDAFSGLVIESCHETTIYEQAIVVVKNYGGSSGGFETSPFQCQRVFKTFSCQRRVLTDLPSLPRPEFKDPVSTSHVANALALLVQLKK